MSKTIAAARGGSVAANGDGDHAPAKAGFWALTLGCIGVVYGDIGTSPLYAMRESVLAAVGPGHAGERAGGARHPVADHLGAAAGGHRQIRADPAARRQQRRGRHAGADGARLARARRQPRRRHRDPARHHQRRAVLRRRHHHAGAVGALGDRRLESRDAGVRRFRGADHGGDPDRAVRGAVARHGKGRRLVRSDHVGLVCRHRRRRALAYRAKFQRPAVVQSVLRRPLPAPPRHHRLLHARRRVPGGDRRGSALRRPGPFRPRSDPLCLAGRRAAGAVDQLSRAGRAGAGRSEGDREPVLPALSALGAAADGGAGDRRHRDRQPGGDHRRLFAHATGDPARPAAAPGNPPHLGSAVRADLHAAGEHAAADRRLAAGGAVPLLERARLGLRHRRHRHHGGHRHDGDRGDPAGVALAADCGAWR